MTMRVSRNITDQMHEECVRQRWQSDKGVIDIIMKIITESIRMEMASRTHFCAARSPHTVYLYRIRVSVRVCLWNVLAVIDSAGCAWWIKYPAAYKAVIARSAFYGCDRHHLLRVPTLTRVHLVASSRRQARLRVRVPICHCRSESWEKDMLLYRIFGLEF